MCLRANLLHFIALKVFHFAHLDLPTAAGFKKVRDRNGRELFTKQVVE